jgi:NADH dehydrogenase
MAKKYDINPDEIRIFNVEAVPDIMRDFGTELAQQAARDLERKGICLLTGVPITKVTSERIELANGRMIPTNTVIWSGGVRASRLVEESSFSTINRGRAKVDGNMRSIDNPNVFVIGDCAAGVDPATGRVVPPTAHNAIDQGLVAAKNILADYGYGAPAVFHVVDLGAVASLGETFAVGKVGKMKLIGRPASIMKEMIELKWIFSLGGVGLVFKRLPRVFHLMRVALQRTVYHRPLVGGSCELPLMEQPKATETPSKPSVTESAATKE